MRRASIGTIACFVLAAAFLPITALAKDEPAVQSITLPDDHSSAKLKPGPGLDTVEANCMGCHSTDYIVRQPPSDADKWQGEVTKMIKIFGAPISDADAKVIANYLATTYGPPPAPPKAPAREKKAEGKKQ